MDVLSTTGRKDTCWDVPVTTSPVSFFATSLLSSGGMGIAAKMSSTIVTIENDSQGSCSNEHELIPSAPPPESPELGESSSSNTKEYNGKNLAISEDRTSLEMHEKDDVNNHLLDDNVVLEPEPTGSIFMD